MQPRAARRRAALSGIRVRSRIAPSSTRRRRTWPRSSSGVNNTSTAKPRPVRLQRNRPARRRSSAPPLRRIRRSRRRASCSWRCSPSTARRWSSTQRTATRAITSSMPTPWQTSRTTCSRRQSPRWPAVAAASLRFFSGNNFPMEPADLGARVQDHIRRLQLITSGEVTVLVSGGADSTCAWHLLRELGYRVSALHVNHRLRGAESDEDARFCAEALGAEVVEAPGGRSEDELRDLRYSFAIDRLRATGHTASDQVE